MAKYGFQAKRVELTRLFLKIANDKCEMTNDQFVIGHFPFIILH